MVGHISHLLELGLDFSNPCRQLYSLPIPLINYSIDNAGTEVSQKLLKCCKNLKLKQSQSIIDYFYISGDYHKFEFGNYNYEKGDLSKRLWPLEWRSSLSDSRIGIDVIKVKVGDQLRLQNIHANKFNFILSKLDLSSTKNCHIVMYSKIGMKDLEQLFCPSLSNLYISLYGNYEFEDANFNMTLLAFQKCQKLSCIYLKRSTSRINSRPLLTNSMFKELLSCERKTKLDECSLNQVMGLDPIDIIKFIDLHINPKRGKLALFLEGINEYEGMKIALQKMRKSENFSCTKIILHRREDEEETTIYI